VAVGETLELSLGDIIAIGWRNDYLTALTGLSRSSTARVR